MFPRQYRFEDLRYYFSVMFLFFVAAKMANVLYTHKEICKGYSVSRGYPAGQTEQFSRTINALRMQSSSTWSASHAAFDWLINVCVSLQN